MQGNARESIHSRHDLGYQSTGRWRHGASALEGSLRKYLQSDLELIGGSAPTAESADRYARV